MVNSNVFHFNMRRSSVRLTLNSGETRRLSHFFTGPLNMAQRFLVKDMVNMSKTSNAFLFISNLFDIDIDTVYLKLE